MHCLPFVVLWMKIMCVSGRRVINIYYNQHTFLYTRTIKYTHKQTINQLLHAHARALRYEFSVYDPVLMYTPYQSTPGIITVLIRVFFAVYFFRKWIEGRRRERGERKW